ncbi:hypothetical protein SAMN05216376_103160 [Mameliella alba]|uniref:hypothetical protein n=1 Tax=Mameliella alba TaxID=561184 RepID=UPI00088941F5|nr:hypothetical protein [Mameliella alba]OWV49057.1 hypothetical protein CDZ96_06305 [Mameliella alba]PTR40961.1 hypothetical protein LX94_01415 [Mameliella alba]GGF47687.1 hypothetical protein GCM10011319_06720 [Mameliella alba]SDC58601.1 hypothetical protein SAMN05216376_103160 [Mameliella alba]
MILAGVAGFIVFFGMFLGLEYAFGVRSDLIAVMSSLSLGYASWILMFRIIFPTFSPLFLMLDVRAGRPPVLEPRIVKIYDTRFFRWFLFLPQDGDFAEVLKARLEQMRSGEK